MKTKQLAGTAAVAAVAAAEASTEESRPTNLRGTAVAATTEESTAARLSRAGIYNPVIALNDVLSQVRKRTFEDSSQDSDEYHERRGLQKKDKKKKDKKDKKEKKAKKDKKKDKGTRRNIRRRLSHDSEDSLSHEEASEEEKLGVVSDKVFAGGLGRKYTTH